MRIWSERAVTAGSLLLCLTVAGCYEPVANTAGSEGYTASESTSEGQNRKETDMSGNEGAANDRPGNGAGGDSVPALPSGSGFRASVEANLKRTGLDLKSTVDEGNSVESRILREYGAVLLTSAVPPSKIMFTAEQEVADFQSNAGISAVELGGARIELQREAMTALMKAVEEARSRGLTITPRDGEEAGRRSFAKTLDLWNSRFLKACDHWLSKRRLTSDQIARLKSLPIRDQVAEVLRLEQSGIYFNTRFDNSILYSVAAPGTSQHLSMLAFDANEYKSAEIRSILAANGWFRTVQNDEPHFTYLGRRESELKGLGLKKLRRNDGEYWVPDL